MRGSRRMCCLLCAWILTACATSAVDGDSVGHVAGTRIRAGDHVLLQIKSDSGVSVKELVVTGLDECSIYGHPVEYQGDISVDKLRRGKQVESVEKASVRSVLVGTAPIMVYHLRRAQNPGEPLRPRKRLKGAQLITGFFEGIAKGTLGFLFIFGAGAGGGGN